MLFGQVCYIGDKQPGNTAEMERDDWSSEFDDGGREVKILGTNITGCGVDNKQRWNSEKSTRHLHWGTYDLKY